MPKSMVGINDKKSREILGRSTQPVYMWRQGTITSSTLLSFVELTLTLR